MTVKPASCGESWARTEALWAATPFAAKSRSDLTVDIVREFIRAAPRRPAVPIFVAISDIVSELLRLEDVIALEAEWEVIDNDPLVASHIRRLLARRGRWCGNYDQMMGHLHGRASERLFDLFKTLPEPCFGSWEIDGDFFGVPLVEMVDRPGDVRPGLADDPL